MRRHAICVAVTILVCAAAAAPAEAQAWRWLEKLSGPGDFNGLEGDIKLWCRYEKPKEEADYARVLALGGFGFSTPCIFKRGVLEQKDPRSLKPGDDVYDLTRRIDVVGFAVSYLRGKNDLPYAPTSESIDRTIQLWAFEGFYDHRMNQKLPRLEVGAAVGMYRFIVPEVSDFSRMTIEPRVTWRLFDLRQGDQYAGTFSMRFGWLWFTEGFDAADFGAIGPYKANAEGGPSFRFIFDFDRFSFKK